MVGCGEDVEALERNLYYDMEEMNSYSTKFLEEYVKQMRIDHTRFDANGLLWEYIDLLEESVNKGIKPPRHLRKEANEWFEVMKQLPDIYRDMMYDMEARKQITPSMIRRLDDRRRIYNNFEEFEW